MIDAVTSEVDIAEAKLALDIARGKGPAAMAAWAEKWGPAVVSGLEELREDVLAWQEQEGEE